MRAERGLPTTLAFAGTLGVLHAVSLSVANAWWLQLVAFGLFVSLVNAIQTPTAARPVRRAAAIGFVFGLCWFVAGVCWLFISMHRYGGMPAPLAAIALLLFCAYLAAFPAAAAALAAWLAQTQRDRQAALPQIGFAILATGAFTLAELLRGWLFTGFPWLSPGYAHNDGPFAGLASTVGVFGVGAAACLCASLLALAGHGFLRARRASGLALAIALTLVASGLIADKVRWEHTAPAPITVDLIQGNVAQDMKFNPERLLATMQTYADALQPGRAQLTVLPETAWILPWSATPPEVASKIQASLENGSLIAIGMPLPAQQSPRQLTNSVAVMGSDGSAVARYDKVHLVPFGEFIPWGFRWFVAMMNIPLGDFGRGSLDQPQLRYNGQALAFNICYEDLFGDELARQVRAGANVLINVSNIAWFGDSHAQQQHLQIARMRSLELARPMLRATNTGVTAAINHRGEVLAKLPGHEFGTLSTSVLPTSGLTPFARWANVPAWLIALLMLAGGTVLARRA